MFRFHCGRPNVVNPWQMLSFFWRAVIVSERARKKKNTQTSTYFFSAYFVVSFFFWRLKRGSQLANTSVCSSATVHAFSTCIPRPRGPGNDPQKKATTKSPSHFCRRSHELSPHRLCLVLKIHPHTSNARKCKSLRENFASWVCKIWQLPRRGFLQRHSSRNL